MADDNRPIKYMRYAIGEIALVVIGILIALSINNWNEERKDKAEAIKILEKLQAEFEVNTTELKASMRYHELQYQAAVKIEELFDPNHKIASDSIANLITQLLGDWKFEPRISITTSALTSGKIALINNDSLIENLNTWMFAINKYDEIHTDIENLKLKYLWPELYEKYPMRNLDPINGVSNFKGDPEDLFSNLKNENIIRDLRYREEFIVTWCKALQEDHNDILRFISLELSENK